MPAPPGSTKDIMAKGKKTKKAKAATVQTDSGAAEAETKEA